MRRVTSSVGLVLCAALVLFPHEGECVEDLLTLVTPALRVETPFTFIEVKIAFAATAISATFRATLNGTDVTPDFDVGGLEARTVLIDLRKGLNILAAEISGPSPTNPARTVRDRDQVIIRVRPPVIKKVTPRSGGWGEVVTIRGKNFGAQSDGMLTFNALKAADIVSWSATKIVAQVPRLTAGGDVVVTVAGRKDFQVGRAMLVDRPIFQDSNPVSFEVTGIDEILERGDVMWGQDTAGNEANSLLPLSQEELAMRAADFGLVSDPDPPGTAGDLPNNFSSGFLGVRAVLGTDGVTRFGITCDFCHTRQHPITGEILEGVPNVGLDLGRIVALSPALSEPQKEIARHWGPGNLDISFFPNLDDGIFNPSNTPTHRMLNGFERLEWTGLGITLEQRNLGSILLTLPTRIPTVAEMEALSTYEHMEMQQRFPNPDADEEAAKSGKKVFYKAGCIACHSPVLGRYTNQEIFPAGVIGTDPRLTMNPIFGTGNYRTPPLVNLWLTAPYLHDGSVGTLEDLFDPARLRADFVRARATMDETGNFTSIGAVRGMEYGLDLPADEKADLIAFLKTL